MKGKKRPTGLEALKAYLLPKSKEEREAFAVACETRVHHLLNIMYGCKPCAEKLAIAIERESNRAVRCEDLRSDVDWQYLRGTETQVA
jgi:DNA-binding transcriptional regulator YdaS (Cro superfamily)